MIKLLNRYIAKTIIISTLLMAFIFTCLLFFMSLLTQLKNLGEGDYDMIQVFLYALLRLPNEFYQFSPLVMLLGSIVGLSILSTHKELAIMRASGFSLRQIIGSVLTAAFFMTMMVSLAGELLAPALSTMAEIQKENAKNAGQAVVTANGVWFHVDNNFIHVKNVVDRQRLEGVTRYEFDNEHHLKAAYFTPKILLQHHQWTMDKLVKTTFYHDRTKSQSLSPAVWNLPFNPNLLNAGLLDPEEMSLPKLRKFTHYLKQNGLSTQEFEYEFWQRLFRPFISLTMIFLSIPFVLGIFSTSTLGRRLLMGLLTGFVFFILNALLGQLCIVFQLPAIAAAALPLVGFAVIGVFLMKRLVRY